MLEEGPLKSAKVQRKLHSIVICVSVLYYYNVSTVIVTYDLYLYMRGTSQDVKRLEMGFLAFILWVFLTIYIVFALLKINMCFKHLEASHIMSFDS